MAVDIRQDSLLSLTTELLPHGLMLSKYSAEQSLQVQVLGGPTTPLVPRVHLLLRMLSVRLPQHPRYPDNSYFLLEEAPMLGSCHFWVREAGAAWVGLWGVPWASQLNCWESLVGLTEKTLKHRGCCHAGWCKFYWDNVQTGHGNKGFDAGTSNAKWNTKIKRH